MKKKMIVKLLCISTFALFLVACANNISDSNSNSSSEKIEQTTTDEDTAKYLAAVENLNEITLDEAQEKIDKGESFYLFIGRPTCQYCRIFAPNLASVLEEVDQEVYYVDSDKNDIVEFADTYQFTTVPHFGYFSNQKEVDYLEKGSQSTNEEIKTILTKSFD